MTRVIPTRYHRYHFRSRTEARWAVYFEAVGIDFEYEPEGYVLGSGEHYLPDFWLPQVKMFAEVKGEAFTPEENAKCDELPYPCLRLAGPPEVKAYSASSSYNPCVPEDDSDGCDLCYALDSEYLSEGRFFHCPSGCFSDDVIRGVAAARSARFEHGETGPT